MKRLLLLLCCLYAFAPSALAQGRGGGRGSGGLTGDNAVLTFSNGTITLGAVPSSGYVLYYNGSTITGLNKGSANGLATLGSDGRVPSAQLPSSAYSLMGTWNASADLTSPGGTTLAGTTPAVGTAYAVTTSGGTTLGSVSSWTAGDLAVYSASGWAKVPASGVTSFNARYGAVSPTAGDYDGLALNLAAASSFRAPQATSCAQTVEGAVCWDTNDDLLTIGDGSSRKTLNLQPTQTTVTATGTDACNDLALVTVGTGYTRNLPTNVAGCKVCYKRDNDTDTLTVDAPSTELIDGVLTYTSNVPYDYFCVEGTGAAWILE